MKTDSTCSTDIHSEFIAELQNLLKKYNAQISADDHWRGYSECGQDIRITVEFDSWEIDALDLGQYVNREN